MEKWPTCLYLDEQDLKSICVFLYKEPGYLYYPKYILGVYETFKAF